MPAVQHLHSDVNLAWPSAKIAVRGVDGTPQLIFSAHDSLLREQKVDADCGGSGGGSSEAPRIARPLAASQYGIVDAVIRPAMTRRHLCTELALLQVRGSEHVCACVYVCVCCGALREVWCI